MRFRLICLLALITLSLPYPAVAQRSPVYFGDLEYRQLGLTEVWSTQIQLDPSRAAMSGMRLQVIGRDAYEVFDETAHTVVDVKYGDGQVRSFRSNQVDRAGFKLGAAEAKRLAEKLEIRLKARGFKTELVERRIPVTMLYVQANSGTLVAMDAETGKTEWQRFIGSPGHPAIIPAASDNYVAAISGSNLHLFERDGTPVWSRTVRQNPSIGATIAGQRIFLPGLRGQIEAYRLPDEISDHRATPPWIYNSSGKIVTLPTKSSSTISWGTDRGSLFVAELFEGDPILSYRFESAGPIYGGAVALPPDHLVVTSTAGFVNLLSQSRGTVSWRFSTGSAIENEPVAHDDEVYVTTVDQRLFSISAETGIERWVVDGINQVLSSGQKNVYALDSFNNLTAIDKETGTILGRLPADGYSQPFVNHVTDRIYLANESGALICLRELGATEPSVRVAMAPSPQAVEEQRERGGSDSATQEEGTEEGDAFGGFDDDGFGDFGDAGADDAGADDGMGDDATDDGAMDDGAFDFDDSGTGFDDFDTETTDDNTDSGSDESADDVFDFGD